MHFIITTQQVGTSFGGVNKLWKIFAGFVKLFHKFTPISTNAQSKSLHKFCPTFSDFIQTFSQPFLSHGVSPFHGYDCNYLIFSIKYKREMT